MQDYQRRFIALALAREALRFGEFKLKSGRLSPYFFNAGLFNDGASIGALGSCYAAALARAPFGFDMLFGPAYKGIPLVTTTAIALALEHGRNVPWAYNRKEAKEHGEAGVLVGSPLKGRVVIIDDVITAGTAIRESIDLIRGAGAEPVAVALALDRQERGRSEQSAVQEMGAQFGLACVAIVTLDDLIAALEAPSAGIVPAATAPMPEQLEALRAYRRQYGAACG
ncbi:MAG: orotate phosphoribosyltransferase [Steroidobacterales bacterium]